MSQKRSAHWLKFVYPLYTFCIKKYFKNLECTYPQMWVSGLALKLLPGWDTSQAVIVTQSMDLSDEIHDFADRNKCRAPDETCSAHSPGCTRFSVTQPCWRWVYNPKFKNKEVTIHHERASRLNMLANWDPKNFRK